MTGSPCRQAQDFLRDGGRRFRGWAFFTDAEELLRHGAIRVAMCRGPADGETSSISGAIRLGGGTPCGAGRPGAKTTRKLCAGLHGIQNGGARPRTWRSARGCVRSANGDGKDTESWCWPIPPATGRMATSGPGVSACDSALARRHSAHVSDNLHGRDCGPRSATTLCGLARFPGPGLPGNRLQLLRRGPRTFCSDGR